MPLLTKIGKNRDSKHRSVQAGIVRAEVPQLLAVQELTATKTLDRVKVMDFAMDTVPIGISKCTDKPSKTRCAEAGT